VAVYSRCVDLSGRRGLRRSLPLFASDKARRFHGPYTDTLAPLDPGTDQGYLAVIQEAGEADKDLVNADLLMMVVLGVSAFFGLSFGWVLTNTQRQRAMCSLGVDGGPSASACKDLPFLGVFRL
jgi:hypothetical protein